MRTPITSYAFAALAASLALAACGSPLDSVSGGGDWRSQARCQPTENPAPGDHAGDGPALSPDEILPDARRCPEAFRGGGPSTAPPTNVPDRSHAPGGGSGREPGSDPDHGCADAVTANGFACRSVPGTGRVIYPGAPGEDDDPPQIPNY
jgi:hypothetical protein